MQPRCAEETFKTIVFSFFAKLCISFVLHMHVCPTLEILQMLLNTWKFMGWFDYFFNKCDYLNMFNTSIFMTRLANLFWFPWCCTYISC